MSENNILGVILAGGQSKRMGKEKSILKLNDKTLIEHSLIKINQFLDNVIIISNKKINFISKYKVEIIEDCLEGNQGPLVGVLSAMEWVKKNNKKFSWLATFPCDTPFFPKDLISKFIKNSISKKKNLYFASSKGQRHNIFGLWSLSLYDKLKNDIINNNIRKVQYWAERNDMENIEFNFKKFDPFFNINTKEDLEYAKKIYKNIND